MNGTFTPACRHGRRAFSLIETVLALGIMALAVTAMLGLLPHGIEMSRKAANAAAETRIVDTISAQLASMPFASLSLQDHKELHFDDQGVMVDGTVDASQATYFVRVLVLNPVGNSGITLPGAITPEVKLLRVNIQIVQTPLIRYNFDTQPPKNYRTVPLLIGAQS